ncbi:MAG: hypothetical protein QOF51_1015, partial [Chloroflexota bacterium]|nr:hypothetical protein [Chloroflexota bacterium]
MTEKLFDHENRVGFVFPEDVAKRYHLADGVEVEVSPTEEGIFLKPIGVEPWFSVEWERALDAVVEWYGPALEELGEPGFGEEGEAADASEEP